MSRASFKAYELRMMAEDREEAQASGSLVVHQARLAAEQYANLVPARNIEADELSSLVAVFREELDHRGRENSVDRRNNQDPDPGSE
jgi:hypothetical protein